MSNSQKIWLIALLVFFASVAWFFHRRHAMTQDRPIPASSPSSATPFSASPTAPTHESPVEISTNTRTSSNAVASPSPKQVPTSIRLNSGNFESYVRRCFEGEPCEFEDSPEAMYKDFKLRENREAQDRLISVLRAKLRTPEGRAAYKDLVRKMIDDFYPPNEKMFQEAAYFNYLGDLDKSLGLYLALEKMSERDPTMTRAPALNIANTYYDLGRLEAALPYYEKATRETTNSESLRFIDERIHAIRARIQN